MLLRETLVLNLAGLIKVPMMTIAVPRVMSLDAQSCSIKVPLRWRTKNHVGSMYIAVLTLGAELSIGVPAMFAIHKGHRKVVLIFKDFHADYRKRADGDVLFRCDEVRAITDAVSRADSTGERVTIPVHTVALVPDKYGDEPVAQFTLGLSLKRKDKKSQ